MLAIFKHNYKREIDKQKKDNNPQRNNQNRFIFLYHQNQIYFFKYIGFMEIFFQIFSSNIFPVISRFKDLTF